MQSSVKPTARREGLVVQELPDEVLVYDLKTNKAHCLNKSAAAVWKHCDGSNSVLNIAALLKKEFNTQINEEFVWLAIDQLGKDNLLTQKINSPTAGMSRREMMRRVGIVSLVSLPVVMSLVAPTAALAAVCTGAAPGTPCNAGAGNGLCCNGACNTSATTVANNQPCNPGSCVFCANSNATCCTSGPNANTCRVNCGAFTTKSDDAQGSDADSAY